MLPRGEIADDVKGLDQDGRASLRKHGVRFGQYTVFLPLLLKPAPTRLRLVLWSLKQGLDGLPRGAAARPRHRAGGARRAARLLPARRLPARRRARDPHRHARAARRHDPRASTPAPASRRRPDMLSITGLSLEQFARLMQGLGYVATEGTRPKRRPAAARRAPSRPAGDAERTRPRPNRGIRPPEPATGRPSPSRTPPAGPDPDVRRRPSRRAGRRPEPDAPSPRYRRPPTPTSARPSRPTCRRRRARRPDPRVARRAVPQPAEIPADGPRRRRPSRDARPYYAFVRARRAAGAGARPRPATRARAPRERGDGRTPGRSASARPSRSAKRATRPAAAAARGGRAAAERRRSRHADAAAAAGEADRPRQPLRRADGAEDPRLTGGGMTAPEPTRSASTSGCGRPASASPAASRRGWSPTARCGSTRCG